MPVPQNWGAIDRKWLLAQLWKDGRVDTGAIGDLLPSWQFWKITAGAAAGATVGAAALSWIPVLGPLAGGLAGSLAGEALYDAKST
jgi:hypothetical protein